MTTSEEQFTAGLAEASTLVQVTEGGDDFFGQDIQWITILSD